MRYLLLFILLCNLMFPYERAQSQDLLSVHWAGGDGNDYIQGWDVDASGNYYFVVGSTGDTYHHFFDSVTTVFEPTHQWLIKTDPMLSTLWYSKLEFIDGISGISDARSFVVDEYGGFYVSLLDTDSTYAFDSSGTLKWAIPMAAAKLSYIGNGKIEASEIQSAFPFGIDVSASPRGAVFTFDTAGNYVRHTYHNLTGYLAETILGKNRHGHYGLRSRLPVSGSYSYENRVELFLCDANGVEIKSNLAGFGSSTVMAQMTYDSIADLYYVTMPIPKRIPLISPLDSSYAPRQFNLLQFDGNFNLLGSLAFNDEGSGIAIDFLEAIEGNVYLGGQKNNSWTHLGMLNYNFANDDQLVLAKIDRYLELKWMTAIGNTNYLNRFYGIAVVGDSIILPSRGDFISGTDPLTDYTEGIVYVVADTDSTSSYIEGKVYLDANQNGVDDLEPGLSGIELSSNTVSVKRVTAADGMFTFSATTGLNTITADYLPEYWTWSGPSAKDINIAVPDTVVADLRFGAYPVPGVNDLEVTVETLTAIRPGFAVGYRLTYRNMAYDTMAGKLLLIQDSNLLFLDAVPSPDAFGGDTISWDYTGLLPGETRYITVYDSLPALISLLGTDMKAQAQILPIIGDTIPADNIDSTIREVTGSYDPNDMSVYPSCIVFPGPDSLIYKVRFQNTGSDTAFTVVIMDILSPVFDPESLTVLSASHDYRIEREDRVVKFIFENILLPDSNVNAVGSNGFIEYSIEPAVPIGEVPAVSSKAAIFFDLNPPIITNDAFFYGQMPLDTNDIFSCGPFVSPSGNIWDTDGFYTDTLYSVTGCDSILSFSVDIEASRDSLFSVESCEFFSVPGLGIVSSSGIYTSVLTTTGGCDSTLTIDVTIHKDVTDSTTIEGCDSIIYEGVTYTSNANLVEYLNTIHGCDSTHWTYIRLVDPEETFEAITVCDVFVYGGQSYEESQVLEFVFEDSLGLGCDSTHTIDLTVITVEPEVNAIDDFMSVSIPGIFYQWIDCDNGMMDIPGANSSVFYPATPGNYAVRIEKDGCTGTSSCYAFDITGIADVDQAGIEVFPSPTKGLVYLSAEQTELRTIEVLNALGELIETRTWQSGTLQIDLEGPQGMYLLRITDKDGQTFARAVVKQ